MSHPSPAIKSSLRAFALPREVFQVRLISRCREQGIQFVLCSLLPVSDYHKGVEPNWERSRMRPLDRIREINRGLRNLVDNVETTYIDLFSFIVDSKGQMPEDMADDGLHPNRKGYELIAPHLRGVIDQCKTISICRPC